MNIPLKPVTSSQIEALGFDEETNTLAIKFKGHNGREGSLYFYANFTREDYVAFSSAESIGSWFRKHIKYNAARFPYVKQ